jgi:hypothetical protein
VGFLFLWFPIVGTFFAVAATAVSIRGVRRNRDGYFAISVLSISSIILSLGVAAFVWSVWVGMYGIAIAPWPP